MLIAALMMVLFANHMDERVASGKRVIRCGGREKRNVYDREKEKDALLVNSSKEADNDINACITSDEQPI